MKQFSFFKPLWLLLGSIISVLGLFNNYVAAQTVSTYVNSISSPKGITVDLSGNVFVLGGYGEAKINKITPSGILSTTYMGINNPSSIVMDKVGSFFIAVAKNPYGYYANSISKINSASNKSTLVDTGSVFKYISALAIDSSGVLYAADNQNKAIYKISSSGVVSLFVTTGISSMQAMTIDNYGNLFVLNSTNGTIVKITAAGAISTFNNSRISSIATCLAVSERNNLYVACNNKTIYKLDTSGAIVDSFWTGVNSRYIFCDKLGYIYTANDNYSISKISSNGSFSYIIPPYIYPNTYRQCLLIDGQNNLYFTGLVVDSNYKYYVNKVSPNGIISKFCNYGSSRSLGAMLKDSLGNIFMAADTAIVSIANNGVVSNYSSTNIKNLNTLVQDKSGNFYISTDQPYYSRYDSFLYKISPLKIISPFAKLPNTIFSTAIDDSDNVYVSCSDNYSGTNTKVFKLDKSGNQTQVLSLGTALVSGMIFDKNKNLYISVHRLNIIFKLSPSGILSTVVNSNLYGPTSLAFDSNEDLFVSNDSTYVISKITLHPLPIQLLAFNAHSTQKKVVTNWQTATEINAKGFAIQHSNDGLLFNTIGKVASKGNGANEYAYTDEAPKQGLNYYRLQMIDNDGTISFSKIVKVVYQEEEVNYSIFPNPAKSFITINGKSINNVSILNSEGKLQFKKDFNDATNPTINVAKLQNGVYYVHINNKTKTIVVPLVIE